MLAELGRPEEALDLIERALAAQPEYAHERQALEALREELTT